MTRERFVTRRCHGVSTPYVTKDEHGMNTVVLKPCREIVKVDPTLKVCSYCLKSGHIDTFPHIHEDGLGQGRVMVRVTEWPAGAYVEKKFKGELCPNGHRVNVARAGF